MTSRPSRFPVRTILISALLVAGAVFLVVDRTYLVPTAFVVLAVTVRAFSPPVLGHVRTRRDGEPAPDVDPAALRRWREERPGTTIADALEAHREGRL